MYDDSSAEHYFEYKFVLRCYYQRVENTNVSYYIAENLLVEAECSFPRCTRFTSESRWPQNWAQDCPSGKLVKDLITFMIYFK